MNIRKVTSKSLLNACRKFLAQDPIANVLPLGDLYLPLFQLSDIYAAVSNSNVVGVCAVYRAFSTPSVVFGTTDPEVKENLLENVMSEIPKNFISLCNPLDVGLFKDYTTITHSHTEQQMIAHPPKYIRCDNVDAAKVKKTEFKILNEFYTDHNAEAWTPIQFKAGPYYCVKVKGKIVSAAGVHLVTPQIAQLGNIVTDEAYRNQGFATACTNLLARNLASKDRIISLFVRTDNAPAIRIYKKIDFLKKHDITFLVMRKN
jgi:ribosomal protein S18 acetylase RimI-like enzyme